MINYIIKWCLENRFIVLSIVALVAGAGVWALLGTPVDAIPDIGEMQVLVIADWPGRSPRDIEDQVTYPLTTKLMGIPRVKTIRGNSAFGFCLVNILFDEGTDFYWARTRVLERINLAQNDMPSGVTPVLGPDASALGQIFWYTIENVYYCPDHPLVTSTTPDTCPEDGNRLVLAETDIGTLRSLQDWYVRYQLTAVKGVSEVASIGGFVRQYQVQVDPDKLFAYRIPFKKIINAISRSNIDIGAKVFEEGGMEFIIRGIGFVKGIEDLERIVLDAEDGVPVTIGDVATVTLEPDFRRNALDKEGAEAVGGVVVMRYGENPLGVINRTKKKITEIEAGLPPGIRIVPFYDRTEVIDRATHTLKVALIEEILVAAAVLLLFLLHLRSTLIIALLLPLGILGAFLIMKGIGLPSNIMSLGGIAIAIGVMVDAGIVMTENIHRHLSERGRTGTRISSDERIGITLAAAREVGPPIFFAILIIIVAFIPVFALVGQSGKLFHPLAFTKTFVMTVSAILSITLLPVLSTFFLRGRLRDARENIITRLLTQTYRPVVRWSIRHRLLVIIAAAVILAGSFLLSTTIPGEFMPPLNEGDLLFMPVLLPGASLTQVHEVMRTQDAVIKSLPEVETVVGKLGRAETATDPAPVAMIETIIKLKDRSAWRPGMTREKLIEEIKEKTQMPGVSPIMTQPIRNRIDMLATGIQTPVGIKVFGSDLHAIENVAIRIEELLREIPGALGPYAERLGNKPYLEIEIDRERISRYGVLLGDVQDVISTAIGGMNVAMTIEGRERYPISVRYPRELRNSEDKIGAVLVSTPDGRQIPLALLATIRRVPGPAMIATENTLPYTRVFVSIDRSATGLMEFVDHVERSLAEHIKPDLPAGVYYSIAGQYQYKREADLRLLVLVPICLFIIYLLLFIKFKSLSSALILVSALPFSFVGAVILQYILGIYFSTAVWVGYIALFGVAVEDGIVILDYMRMRTRDSTDFIGSAIEAGVLRVRPILMTTATTVLALLPVMFATGTGSEVMIPIAVPTVGGMITCTISNLIIVPVLFTWIESRHKQVRRSAPDR
ncbi:MAG TPA: CusA/CzcA family heavy metal efflux RND transporter [Patescibacteria group bacterium]|nr:CusA/CzcA family heavy metal efflux RND transporter [Patescibacteria group bacterium]